VCAVRFDAAGWIGIDAHTGQRLHVDEAMARQAAERFAGSAAVAVARIARDQWTVSGNLDPHRPRYAVQMADGGLHHVSSCTAEVLRNTAQAERAWNCVGAVVHWVYPTVLRSAARLWHWTGVVLASYALATALLGTVIGVLRWRPYARGKHSPYSGWKRWHHLLGLGGALFVLAWLFSGLLSMNPFDVFSPRRLTAPQLASWGGAAWAPTLPVLTHHTQEVEWFADPGGTLGLVRAGPHSTALWQQQRSIQVDEGFVRARAAALKLGEAQAIERLDSPDLHYHARHSPRPLPIWRVRFADPAQTWVHIDGHSGQPFARIDASSRAQRWLYHGLHSWDFGFLLNRRPLWDLLMLPAMLIGSALSLTSVVLAWRRLRPHTSQRCRRP
jgi:hypothetical protein